MQSELLLHSALHLLHIPRESQAISSLYIKTQEIWFQLNLEQTMGSKKLSLPHDLGDLAKIIRT